jgi:hypothetical protein
MPLTSCPDCEKEVSTLASSCPHCGRPMHEADTPAWSPAQARQLEEINCRPDQPPAVSPGFMRGLGVLLLLGGIMAGLHYHRMDTTVLTPSVELFGQTLGGERVHNIGLMEQRRTGITVSIAGTFFGLMLIYFAHNLERRSQ